MLRNSREIQVIQYKIVRKNPSKSHRSKSILRALFAQNLSYMSIK